MADGGGKEMVTNYGGGGNAAAVEVVRVRRAAGISYAYAPNGERTAPFAGNLNLSAKKERFALAPWRVARFAFQASRVVDTNNYLTVSEGDVSLFNVGSGGAYTLVNGGMTGVATDAESQAGPQGAIVRNGATFVAVGLEIVRERPWFTSLANAADQLRYRERPAWVSESGPFGFDYGTELQELVEAAAFFRYQLFPNTQVQEQRCGALADWMARGSKITHPGNFVAFTSEYGSGGQKTSSQLQSFITLGGDPARQIRVQERLGLTLPATGTLVLPYAMRLWGYTVCGDPPDDDVCALPGASAQSLGSLRQQAVQLKQMLEAGELDRDTFLAMMDGVRAAMLSLKP